MIEDHTNVGAPLTALNAIKLSAREVATTFIAPPAFDDLIHADNAILTGPRGSGKTTLLKMLQSEALEVWRDPSADAARETVQAVGVFIGTDRTWNQQLSLAGMSVEPNLRSAIAWAAFGTHTYRSLVDAMGYRVAGRAKSQAGPHLACVLPEQDEREVASWVSELLEFTDQATSLQVLSQMLRRRLLELGTIRQRIRRGVEVELPSWCDLDVLPLVDAAVGSFNSAVKEPDRKWAMLFDELELAPPALVRELLTALRGHQPNLLFKLSLAPANDMLGTLEGPDAPVPGQDYEHIPLTHARKTATLRFAKELVQKTLEYQGVRPAPSSERLLGVGPLDSADDPQDRADATSNPRGRANPYAIGSVLWERMNELARRDSSFRDYLIKNHMDLAQLERLSPAARASKLRKIRNLVVVREYFRNEYGRRRSRKSYALYAGADNILSLPDGNPRMLIALARELLPAIDGVGSAARVTAAAQGKAIEATLRRFLPLLEAQEAVRIGSRAVGLVEFADWIGQSLATRLVESDFNDNLRLSFHVDERVRGEVLELVKRGVNTGAFVYVPPRDSDGRLRGELTAKQFRLSHLLATRYGLPIHLTPSAPLSSLLPTTLVRDPKISSSRSRSRGRAADPSQKPLFPRTGSAGSI